MKEILASTPFFTCSCAKTKEIKCQCDKEKLCGDMLEAGCSGQGTPSQCNICCQRSPVIKPNQRSWSASRDNMSRECG